MEIEGVVFIKDWKPSKEGAFALVCWINGEWIRVASIDDSALAIVQRQMNNEEVASETTGPLTRHGRAIAKVMCKSISQVMTDIENNSPSRTN